ncbi:hypothetical protein MMC21_004876 [Puttea exsequens]|nr:hypothetical protein [Puttea exsequens]
MAKRELPKFASFGPKLAPQFGNHDSSVPPVGESQAVSGLSTMSASTITKLSQKHSANAHGRHKRQVTNVNAARRSSSSPETFCSAFEKPSVFFAIDKVGDLRNVTFGAPDRYITPSYVRYGDGRVIGVSSNQIIDQKLSDDQGLVILRGFSDGDRNVDGHYLRKADKQLWQQTYAHKLKPIMSSFAQQPLGADFVPLDSIQRQKQKYARPSHSPYCSEEVDSCYKSVIRNHEEQQESVDLFSDGQDSTGSEEADLSENGPDKRAELSKIVKANPTSFCAWLNLIDHQSSLVDDYSQARGLTDSEKSSNAQVKLSMYEKALESVTNPSDREVMLLGMMREATATWGTARLESRWRSVLASNATSSRLWTAYLDFRQTTGSFRYEPTRDCYLECLSTLRSTHLSPFKSILEQEKAYEDQIYVILRLTLLMRESGFHENALAAWQALLEYELFRPVHLQGRQYQNGGSCHHKTLSSFEQFWDSEVARLGEEGSEGWADFCVKGGLPPKPRTDADDTLKHLPHTWTEWLTAEHSKDCFARETVRTIDQIAEEDPYRVILYSDIQSFLIDSPTSASRRILLDAFLIFCQLPVPGKEYGNASLKLWRSAGFLHGRAMSLENDDLEHWNLQRPVKQNPDGRAGDCTDYSSQYSIRSRIFDFPITGYQSSLDSLFTFGENWFSAFDAWYRMYNRDCGPAKIAWVLRSLKSLVCTGAGGDDLAEFLLGLELRVCPENVKKTSKTLLKRRPSSLRLYNAYALIEYRLDNAKKGEDIFITSISMSNGLDELAQQDTILIWRTWIWELLNAGKTGEALLRLLSYGSPMLLSPSAIRSEGMVKGLKASPSEFALLLQTEQALTITRDNMFSSRRPNNALLAVDCLITLAYLWNAQSLDAATSVFRSNLAMFSTGSPSCELLHQYFARLCYHHVTHMKIFKPSGVRFLLAESAAAFPHNTLFLSLYAWNEARFRIDDRVRSILKKVALAGKGLEEQQTSVQPHFFAIWTELHRSIGFGSNTSTIRSTFERAVGSGGGAHCAEIWKLYFFFELSREESRAAKTIFWRALRVCPWVKDLYLLAFTFLGDVFTDDDLAEVYQLLNKRELRLRVEEPFTI